MLRPSQALVFQFKPDVNIGVFARGGGIGITFEITQQVDVINFNSLRVVGPTFASEQQANEVIAGLGGEVAFIKSILAAINLALKELFGVSQPSTPGGSTGNVIDRLNAAFANSFEFYIDATGAPQVRAKAGV